MVRNRIGIWAAITGLVLAGGAEVLAQPADGGGRDGARPSDRQGERDGRRRGGDRGDRGDRGGRRGGGWGSPSDGLLGGPMGRVSGSIFRPLWMTRDLELIDDELRLDDGQRDVVAMVLDDYDASFRMAVEETMDAMRDLGEASDVESLQAEEIDALRGRMESMREEMRSMREQARGEDARPAGEEAGSAGEGRPEESEADREAREARMQTMREEFRERMRSIRDEFRTVREAQLQSDEMQTLLNKQLVLLRQFQRASDGMAAQSAEAIQAVLTEEQASRWGDIDRLVRRLRALPNGRLQGERTDLPPLVQAALADAAPESAEAARVILSAWELDIDDALRARQAFDMKAVFSTLEAMQAADYEALLDIMKRRRTLQEGVRDVTDTAIDALAVSIAAPHGKAIRDAALAAGYDRVFRPTRAQRAIESALQLEELDQEVIEAIEVLQAGCDADMASENETLLAVIRMHDEPREMGFIKRMMERAAGEDRQDDDDDPIREAYDHRNSIDEEYLERLRELLGEELAATIPSLRPREERGSRWGGDDRGGDREARRQEFMQRFDANGDGEIDDAEREKIREYFQQMRESGGRGGRGGPGGSDGSGGPSRGGGRGDRGGGQAA